MNARFCKCGHNVISHYAACSMENGGIMTAPSDEFAKEFCRLAPKYKFGPFKCHGDDCYCRLYTEDRSLWNQFKRWLRR